MPDESRVQQWRDILQTLAKMGGQREQTKIIPNCEVMDTVSLPGWVIIRNNDGYRMPAVVIAGLTVNVGDFVNVLFLEGTEAIVLTQGTGSPATGSGWPYSKVISVDPTDIDADYTTISAAATAAVANDCILVGNKASYAEANITLPVDVSLVFFDNYSVQLLNTTNIHTLILPGNTAHRLNVYANFSDTNPVYAIEAGATDTILNECRIRADNTNAKDATAHAYGVYSIGAVEMRDCDVFAYTLVGTIACAVRILEGSLYDCHAEGMTHGLYVDTGEVTHVYGGFLKGTVAGLYISAGATVKLHNLPRIEGGVTNLGTIEGAWIDENGDIVYGGTTTPVLKGFGSNVPNIGSLTAAEQWGNIYQANAKDIYPCGDLRGLATRWINPVSLALTDEFHFRTGAAPAGYTWLNDGVFSGNPTLLDYSRGSEYLMGTGGGAGVRHFMQKAVTNAAASWQNKYLYARCTTGNTTEMGVRLDVGDDTEYCEVYIDGVAANGTISITFRYRKGSGAVTTVASALLLPAGDFQGLALKCHWTGTVYQYYGYMIGGAGTLVNLTGFFIAATPGVLPCAGRAGLFVKNSGNVAFADWLWSTFT